MSNKLLPKLQLGITLNITILRNNKENLPLSYKASLQKALEDGPGFIMLYA